MSFEPVWVSADHVIAMNEVLVNATGEKHFVRDHGALEGALARPVNHHQYEGMTEIHELAAHLVLAIGKAHAFEQGNKRTAWAAGRLFLRNNGYQIQWKSDTTQRVVAKTVENMMVEPELVSKLAFVLKRIIEPILDVDT